MWFHWKSHFTPPGNALQLLPSQHAAPAAVPYLVAIDAGNGLLSGLDHIGIRAPENHESHHQVGR